MLEYKTHGSEEKNMVTGREGASCTNFSGWKASGIPAEEDIVEWTDTGLGPGDWDSRLAWTLAGL